MSTCVLGFCLWCHCSQCWHLYTAAECKQNRSSSEHRIQVVHNSHQLHEWFLFQGLFIYCLPFLTVGWEDPFYTRNGSNNWVMGGCASGGTVEQVYYTWAKILNPKLLSDDFTEVWMLDREHLGVEKKVLKWMGVNGWMRHVVYSALSAWVAKHYTRTTPLGIYKNQ